MSLKGLAQRLGAARYHADEHYASALRACRAGDRARAIAAVEAAIATLPRHAEYHAALGFLLLDDKQRTPAAAAFERALALNPYEMLANYGRGMQAYRTKDWGGGRVLLSQRAGRPAGQSRNAILPGHGPASPRPKCRGAALDGRGGRGLRGCRRQARRALPSLGSANSNACSRKTSPSGRHAASSAPTGKRFNWTSAWTVVIP